LVQFESLKVRKVEKFIKFLSLEIKGAGLGKKANRD
jgi:hypothetical protein